MMKGPAARIAGAMTTMSASASALIVFLCLGIAAFGASEFLGRASLDSRVESLLPSGTAAHEALDEARQRYPAASTLYLVVQSPDAEKNRRIAREMLSMLEEHEEVLWAIAQRDATFFLDRRLLYVPTEALAELAAQTERYVEWHRCDTNPLCVSLEDEPPEPDFGAAEESFQSDSEAAPLLELFGLDELPSPGESAREDGPANASLGDLCSESGDLCVVQAALRGNASDLAYATSIYDDLDARVTAFRTGGERAGEGEVHVHIMGRVRNLVHSQTTLKEDLGRTALLSLTLVLLVLLVQFRGLRALLVLAVPLSVGAGWTALFVAHFTPVLNLISAATLAVLAGLGIDFGLHLLTHYSHQRESAQDVRLALRHTLQTLLPSLSAAGVTTAAGFGAVACSTFPGFVQMGVVASVGIVLTLLAYFLVLPLTLILFDSARRERRTLTRTFVAPEWMKVRFPRHIARLLVVSGVLAMALGLAFFPRLELEDDYSTLQASGVGVPYGEALRGTTGSPVLLMADSPRALNEAVADISRRYPDGPHGDGSAWLFAPSMFIPSEPEERLEIIARVRDEIDALDGRLDERQSELVSRWRPLIDVREPIEADTLPLWARSALSEASGEFGTIALIYVALDSHNSHDMEMLGRTLEEWRLTYPDIRIASFGALLGDVSVLVREDAPQIVLIAALGLLIITLLVGRSFRRTVSALFPVLMASALAVGLMVFVGVKVNLYNLMMFPVAFGIAVDGAVYLVWTLEKDSDFDKYPVVGRAILASTLTTMGAFGSMLISRNPGLASLGALALITLSCALVTNLFWLPAALSLRRKK